MNKLQVIEWQNQRVLLTSQLAKSYETTTRRISENFNANKERYIEEKHFYCLEGDALRNFRANTEITDLPSNINKLYLWTEKGTLLHAKSLNTDKAWEVYDRLVETYFRVKEVMPQLNNLSPQLQLLINMEIEQNKMKEQIQEVKTEVQGIRDVVAINLSNWRKETTNVINKVAQQQDGNYQNVRAESYKMLEQRARCDLKARRRNMKLRLMENGVSQSKADRVTMLDVIESDRRLTEIYISIIKEMAIKNGVNFERGKGA